jgi:predicted metal-dependent enzyme (double-stranded beta helix superfamily)
MTTLAVLPLLETLRTHAADPDLLHLLEPHPRERQWVLLLSTDDVQLWLIAWPPGASTGWHDHGNAHGAFTTLQGALVEHSWDDDVQRLELGPGDARAFSSGHVHDVRNDSDRPALSLHAYSPRLTTMTRSEVSGGWLVASGVERAGESW